MAQGARFLERQQRDDGSLRGFCLYPGASSCWLTAHVCFVVESVPLLDRFAARGARYLSSHGADDGGWGYNRHVAVDCDSTAQALMVLQRFALPTPEFLCERLAAAQTACGGYPTYVPLRAEAPRDAWQTAHVDVSAMVLECLRRSGAHAPRVARGEAWLEAHSSDGVLTSYWWNDDAYGLWLQARTGGLSGQARSALRAVLTSPLGCPQWAMAVSAALAMEGLEDELRTATRRLLAAQLADGSWPCAPCLRVTSPHYRGPLRSAPGAVVADRRRVFATAHAVAALHALRARF